MGKRGPRPKPTHLRILHGDRKDRINTKEPAAPEKMPTMPRWLPEPGKRVWKRLAPELHKRKLLTDFDRESFAAFCNAVATLERAQAEVTKRGYMMRDRDGALRKNPMLQVVRDSATLVRGFAQEFGLTPSARSGITIDTGDDSELERILSGR